MGNTVRSAKGVAVDFDYLKIKQQLASAPPPVDVRTRQNFIENRLKRRLKKKLDPVVEVAPTLPEPAEALLVTDEVVTVDKPLVEEVAVGDDVQTASTRTIKQPIKRKPVKKKAE